MKNKILKGIALCAITALFIACQPKKEETAAAPAVDKESIKAELQTMESAFADAMNAGKPELIVYYSDDVISYDQNAAPLNGKKAVDAKLAEQVALVAASEVAIRRAAQFGGTACEAAFV